MKSSKSRRKRLQHSLRMASADSAAFQTVPSGGSASVGFAQTYDAHNNVRPLAKKEQDQLTGTDLRVVHDKATRLVNDCPYALGPIASVADYLGPAKPRAGTDDQDWNQEADLFFSEAVWDAGKWDASGKFTSPHAQRQMSIYADTHGDVLNVFTEHEDGMPCIRMIPAPMVASPWETYGIRSDWRDGVREGLHHRHLQYHILADENAPVRLADYNRKGFTVDAADACMIGNFKVGGVRGYSRLIPTGSTIVQMQMYDNSTHDLLNLASKIGMSLETAAGSQKTDGPKPVLGSLRGLNATQQVNNNGDETTVRHYQEQFLSDGPAVIAPGPGQSINLHNLDRDLPDLAALRGSDYERIAMCYGLPVTILFCIQSGLFNVTGPNVRLALGRAKTWRDQELQKREPLIRRHYARIINWAIKTGQLPKPKKDSRFWRCRIQWAKNYTIDEARDVSNDMKRLAMGATSMKEIAEEYGGDAARNVADNLEIMNLIYRGLEKNGLPTTTYFPSWNPAWQAQKGGADPADGPQPPPATP